MHLLSPRKLLPAHVLLAALIFGSAALPNVATAQDIKSRRSFNVEKFLKRLDVNGNGKVEPGEIKDDRTRNFLKKAGVDTSKSVSIRGFSKRIKKEREGREQTGAGQMSPGFAVEDNERDAEIGDSPGFAVTQDEREPVEKARTREFSAGAKKMLDWVLKNYDKNKDGKIDKNEIKAARWADPPAHVSDTNKDGSLSRMELLIRYQNREDRKAKSDSRKTSSRRERSRERESGRRTSKSSGESSTSGKTAAREVRKGYESYVNGLFKTYDKNKDGQLDSKEIDAMRRKPDKRADKNRDKKISKSELIDSYVEKAGGDGNSRGGSRNRRSSGRPSASRSSRSSGAADSSGSPASRPQLTSKDTNRNGQIEMAEFTTDWTVEKYQEFRSRDSNGDGVITASEWNQKK